MKRSSLLLPGSVLAASVLLAYLATDGRDLLGWGLTYPGMALTHILAAVGLAVWAGRLGGDAAVALPVVFILGIALGYLLAAEVVPLLYFVEPIIWISAVTLLFAAAWAVRVPLEDAIGVTLLFGLYHGHALGELGSAEALLIDLSVLTVLGSPQAWAAPAGPSLPSIC